MITAMATRIGAGRRPHLYITERMAHKGMTNASIANKLENHRSTVGKWRDKGDAISIDELKKLAFALDLEDWREFLRPPGQESVDFLIEDAPEKTREAIVDFVKKMGRWLGPGPKAYPRPFLAICGPIGSRKSPCR